MGANDRRRRGLTSTALHAQRIAARAALRAGIDLWERYEQQWALLRASAWTAPVLLPPDMRAVVDEPRIQFPDWHPWSSKGVPDFEPAGRHPSSIKVS